MSLFGGKATIVFASDYVSTFRGEGVEPDLVCAVNVHFQRGRTTKADPLLVKRVD
jgi:hypothetical protein